jgi:hypothetical protein
MPIPAERDIQKTRIVIKIGLLVEQSGRSVSSSTKNPLTLDIVVNCQVTDECADGAIFLKSFTSTIPAHVSEYI